VASEATEFLGSIIFVAMKKHGNFAVATGDANWQWKFFASGKPPTLLLRSIGQRHNLTIFRVDFLQSAFHIEVVYQKHRN
jgi:hypothetical protein